MTSLAFIFVALLEYILVLNTNPRFCTERRKEEKNEKMKSLYKVSDFKNPSLLIVIVLNVWMFIMIS